MSRPCAIRSPQSTVRSPQSAVRSPPSATCTEPSRSIRYEPFALFFGRLEPYKGLDTLLQAWATVMPSAIRNPQLVLSAVEVSAIRLVLAGPGSLDGLWPGPLPARVELRNRLIQDDEAADLLRRCGLLVLPYLDATQSALVALAYFFHKPVLVTRTGALPEYVQHGRTGWVVEPGDAAALADCLAEALSDPARLARLGAAGRAWYDEQRRLEEKTLLAMYERLVSTAEAGE